MVSNLDFCSHLGLTLRRGLSKTLLNEFPEALCWCLIATMATFIAVVREDAFFTALFAALSGFALTIAMRQGGEN